MELSTSGLLIYFRVLLPRKALTGPASLNTANESPFTPPLRGVGDGAEPVLLIDVDSRSRGSNMLVWAERHGLLIGDRVL